MAKTKEFETTLNEIRVMKDELQKKIESVGKSSLKKCFIKFFDENPSCTSIRWEQYTPYFNDGDACVFGVYEFRYAFELSTPKEGDYEDGFLCRYDFEGAGYVTKEFKAAASKFEDGVVDKDIFLSVFGDHSRITVTRAGFTIEHYDHD